MTGNERILRERGNMEKTRWKEKGQRVKDAGYVLRAIVGRIQGNPAQSLT